MSITVCLGARCLDSPQAGGHQWVFLNWALGLRELGCQVIWLEVVKAGTCAYEIQTQAAALKSRLERYGLAECLALCSETGEPLPRGMVEEYLDLDAAAEADLLLNLLYHASPKIVRRFRRSALLDIDPGLLQFWIASGWKNVARHDVYFTIGETVGVAGSGIPDVGVTWYYTPPCVALRWWPRSPAPAGASFTTIAHWWAGAWLADDPTTDDKRSGFLPFLDLPRQTTQSLELAIDVGPEDEDWVVAEQDSLRRRGWKVVDGPAVTGTPWNYKSYIQQSIGEFSCAKPACVRLQNAWISDRTLCYLASGKPAVVQYTGPSRFLPDAAGLFRFRDVGEAARYLEHVTADYERQCRLARALAEEYFDARKVVRCVLERALV